MSYLFRRSLAFALASFALLVGHAMAGDEDQRHIRHAMMAVFDKPTDRLSVAPVVVEGNYAVADWLQSGRGGRAVLHKEHGKWVIMVCGGDGLKEARALAQTGMSAVASVRLAKALAAEEAKLSPQTVKMFSLFDGVIKVGAEHNAHHPAPAAAKH
jgi:hypothetical protein